MANEKLKASFEVQCTGQLRMGLSGQFLVDSVKRLPPEVAPFANTPENRERQNDGYFDIFVRDEKKNQWQIHTSTAFSFTEAVRNSCPGTQILLWVNGRKFYYQRMDGPAVITNPS